MSSVFPSFDRCPTCDYTPQLVTTVGDRVNFVCAECGLCWHFELGYFYAVNPATCPGCRYRPICTHALIDLTAAERVAAVGRT